MVDTVLKSWIGWRTRTRGFGLPFFASPLILAALFGALGGDEWIVLGGVLGFGSTVAAARVLRRGRKGDADRAAAASDALMDFIEDFTRRTLAEGG